MPSVPIWNKEKAGQESRFPWDRASLLCVYDFCVLAILPRDTRDLLLRAFLEGSCTPAGVSGISHVAQKPTELVEVLKALTPFSWKTNR